MASETESHNRLTAGAARTDVTPENGRTFEGYVRPDIKAKGVAHRLFAHALVLETGGNKIALISSDLLTGFDKDELLSHLKPYGFDRNNVLHAGTHTHAGKFEGSWAISRIAEAVKQADENRVPAEMGWSSTTVDNVNQSRSLEAHLANHGMELPPGEAEPEMDPEGDDHPRDTTLRVLRVDALSGDPLAVLCNFCVHPTSYTPHNAVFSADFIAAARCHFHDALPSDVDPVVVYLNGTQGDLITKYDDYNQFALANTLGKRFNRGLFEAWSDAENELTDDVTLEARSTKATYRGQDVEPGKPLGTRALFGIPFIGGGKNGPSFFYSLGLEGLKMPSWFSGDVQGRKLVVAPAPWDPEVEVQSLRVDDHMLLTVPGEPTVQMGRRTIDEALDYYDDELEDAMIVGLANGYHGYFTTPEEYDRQHYEGGHTVFGKHTEALVRRTHAELLSDAHEDGSGSNQNSDDVVEPGEVSSPVGKSSDGELVQGPSPTVERYEVVEVQWTGAGDGTDRPIGDPFVTVERQAKTDWNPVSTDLDLGLIWFAKNGNYLARYDVPGDLELGRYRFRINGCGYDLTTEPFTVEPSSKLRIRGAELLRQDNSETVVFKVQNPPPDPQINLRPRHTVPRNGEFEFEVSGHTVTANWDEDNQGWITEIPALAAGDEITVADGAFEDSHGNRNGESVNVTVGQVDGLDWPDDMKTGGGFPPGPFGFGVSTVPK